MSHKRKSPPANEILTYIVLHASEQRQILRDNGTDFPFNYSPLSMIKNMTKLIVSKASVITSNQRLFVRERGIVGCAENKRLRGE
jgi:hypothetical protein